MRPIRFRAQDIASNKWLFGDIRHHKNDVCIFEQGGNRGEQVKPETIGQFTGLTDRHGKEIYEGDILRCVNDGGTNIVTHHKGAFGLTKGDPSETFVAMCNSYWGNNRVYECVFEVVGNIHDNSVTLWVEES